MSEEVKGLVNDKAGLIKDAGAIKQIVNDAYSNIGANLGLGSNNLSQQGRYFMERFSWDYMTLNTLFRNNWIAKGIIEKPANEMLKNGFQIQSQIAPDKEDRILKAYNRTKTSEKFLDCVKWARLYGGCLLIPLIKGQKDLSKPLDYDTIMPGSYKGCFVVDRWSGVSPSLMLDDDIESEEFGQPLYYDVTDKANNSFATRIHASRVIKVIGRKLPYWEEIAESYWGASELEHVFTELRKRDDTSANIAFLVFLANIRTLKVDGLDTLISVGDQDAASRYYQSLQQLNRLMCNTGILALSSDDEFAEHSFSFAGLNDIYESFMLDIAGAAEIPVDKLFGRTPNGFASGKETLQNYYDTIQEKQEAYIRYPLEKLLKIICMSELGKIPDDFELVFNSIRRPSDLEKSDIAQKYAQPVFDAVSAGLFGKETALKELRQQAEITGVFSNITDEMIIQAAEDDKKAKEEEESANEEMENQLTQMEQEVSEKS